MVLSSIPLPSYLNVNCERKNMVRLTIELSKLEIVMLLNCIEAAFDTGHVPEESEESVKKLKEQLSKYL
jgi:hypothetical protein